MPWWGWLICIAALGIGILLGLLWFAWQFGKGMNW
jgi:hypothetical protein